MAELKTTNILVVGIGGQGIMTASEILSEAAIASGNEVKKTEIAGMAQRGGVVTSHVRFGPKVLSPNISPGDADVVLAFEAAEGLRWAGHLKPGGVAMVNNLQLIPPVVTIGLYDYPEDPIGSLRKAGITVHDVDAGAVASELGDMRLVNSVMLGAIADLLPFGAETLKACIVARFAERKPKLVPVNEQAFDAGRELARKSQERAAAS